MRRCFLKAVRVLVVSRWALWVAVGATAVLPYVLSADYGVPGNIWLRCFSLAAIAAWALASGVLNRDFRGRLQMLAMAAAVAWVSDRFLRELELRSHPRLGAIEWCAAAVARLQGMGAFATGEGLLVLNGNSLFRIQALSEFIGLRVGGTIWVVLCSVVAWRARLNGRLMALTALAVLAGLTLRFAALALIYSSDPVYVTEHSGLGLSLFWDLTATLLAVAPAIVLAAAYDRGLQETPSEGLTRRRSILVVAGSVLIGLSITSHPSGGRKEGRVLIDDSLNRVWEPAGRLLDDERYGDFSTYSFSAFTEYLSHRYDVTVNRNQPYTLALLCAFDVLVIKTPEVPPTSEAVAAIRAWTAQGGGLFLIGDHTDLLGMSGILNELAEGSDLYFRNDSTSRHGTGNFDNWERGPLSRHPIVASIESMEFMTPCSIAIGQKAEPLMVLDDSMSQAGDYSENSNFGRKAASPDSPQGLLCVAGVSEVGNGRVALFGDSTVFSSFAFYMENHYRLAERVVEWLNHKNALLPWRLLTASLGALIVCCALFGKALRTWLGTIWLGSVAGLVGAWMGSSLGRGAIECPVLVEGVPRLGLALDGGTARFPPVLGAQPELGDGENLSSFIQLPQRLGMEVFPISRESGVPSDVEYLLVCNPDTMGVSSVANHWVSDVLGWVERGGKLLVVAKRGCKECSHDGVRDYVGDEASMESVGGFGSEYDVRWRSLGKGRIVVLRGTEDLDVEGLGHCMALPTKEQRGRLASIRRVFEELLGCAAFDRRTYRPLIEYH